MSRVGALVVVLGDQLDADAAAFDGFDPAADLVWMAEVDAEATHVWSSKQRIAVFLSAMRHFAAHLDGLGRRVDYVRIDQPGNLGSLAQQLRQSLERQRPQRLVMTAPGEWRVLEQIRAVAKDVGLPLELRADRHFYSSVRDFAAYSKRHKVLRLESFYRELRRKHGVLMNGTQPVGERWNFDSENRAAFAAADVKLIPERAKFEPDALSRDVIDLVERRFAAHPGSLSSFAWPVTREQARNALDRFIADRLPHFGRFQDAMWQGEAWAYHSHLSCALNLKLLNPREVVAAAEAAYRRGAAPLAGVEGFIRQVLGWREYIRGVYWTQMPAYVRRNDLGADEPLPAWYWTGDTDMACLRDAIEQTLRLGYAHHIQRLMITGLYALLLGARPHEVHEWYLAVYVDAVEWAELPNTLGMSQYADSGLMASKPYIASGKYIDRMSNYCSGCKYDPGLREGPTACPFTTLYWDFLIRHTALLAANPRMTFQLKNLARLTRAQQDAVVLRAAEIRRGAIGTSVP